MKQNKRLLILLVALALIVGIATGGTLAWLTDDSGPVNNVFTSSDINIELTETTDDFQMVPGYTIYKDPKVTVKANSEQCYLFVKLEKSLNYDTFLEEYTIENDWQPLEDSDGVYYRVVDEKDIDQSFDVIDGNKVTVKTSVTKSDMEGIKTNNMPTLTVTAYACQYNKSNNTPFTPAEAWKNISD